MVAHIKLDEPDNSRNRPLRKCSKSLVVRAVAVTVILFTVLMTSLIYYGVVLDRMEKLRQIVALDLKHGKHPTESIGELRTNIKLLRDSDGTRLATEDADANAALDSSVDSEDATSLRLTHARFKYIHHRMRRQLRDDPMLSPLLLQADPDFEGLYANVRNKRTKIALSKLEKEYARCKKETMNGNDCIVAFVRMYKIAKDISEKMEKMKEIFRDSELVLQRSSSSKSLESQELLKNDTSPEQMPLEQDTGKKIVADNDAGTKVEHSTIPAAEQNSSESTSTEPTANNTTTSTSTSTTLSELTTTSSTPPPRPTRPKPAIFSWIIDGNDDYGEDIESSVESTVTIIQTTPSTTSTSTSTMASTTTDVSSTAMTDAPPTNAPKPKFTKPSWILDAKVKVDTVGTTTAATDNQTAAVETTTEVWGNITTISDGQVDEESSGPTTDSSTATTTADLQEESMPTTVSLSTEEIYSPTTDTEQPEDDIFPKLQFDVEDSTDETTNATSASTTEAFVSSTIFPAFPTKPKPVRISWIIDGDEGSAEQTEPTTNATDAINRAYDANKSSESEENDSRTENVIILTSAPELHHTVSVSNSSGVTVSYGCATMPNLNGEKNRNCSHGASVNETEHHRPANVHPLDYPTSVENMLESFEQEDVIKPMRSEQQENEVIPSPYDPKTWEKKFKEAAGLLKTQEELMDTFANIDGVNMTKFSPKLNPANASVKTFEGNPPPFMSTCEQLAKRMHGKGANSASFANGNANAPYTEAPNPQFTSRGPGGFPVTGETMKASAQFMYNPNFGMPTVPICFYVTPASFRMLNQAPFWTPTYPGMPGGYGMPFMGGGGGPGGIYFVPQTFGATGNFFGHSSGTGGGVQGNIPNIFSKSASPFKQQQQQQQQATSSHSHSHHHQQEQSEEQPLQHKQNQNQNNKQQQQQQFFCTYMPGHVNGGNQAGSGPGNGVGSIGFSNANFKLRTLNQTISTDIIYASYAGLPDHLGHRDHFKCKLPGQVGCYGGNECIAEHAWCDGSVDCSDGSDEATCTCRDRLVDDRICDGYADCPMGEDEIGCFGCENFMISCYDSLADYERFNRSTVSMCYSSMEKCDGYLNCLNGKDERDCSMIVSDVSHHMSHSVSSSEGFLYRNHRGEWYPVCNNAEKWAKEACAAEGDHLQVPNISFHELKLPGPFIEPSLVGSVHFPQSCQERDSRNALIDHVSYVKCDTAKCGTTIKPAMTALTYSKARFRRSGRPITQTWNVNSNGRIVGGTQSKPLHWPFVVALYRNGNFHCGATIYSEIWVISAAHCVLNYQKYYYEVRAGVLRRSSYSLTTQIRPVSHVIVHQAYERFTMRNDLSLLRLAEPLKFNRWVRPVCLPDMGRTTMGDDWIWGPEKDTLCTAVGWGAVREKGPGSDQLREVALPIRKQCTEKEDQEAENICAGDISGGRDACQGDSGGPLFCRSVSNKDEWYLAGVVSHGNGCARPGEFGVYTRVALFLDWIAIATRPDLLPQVQPLQMCPGYVCVWGGKRCIAQKRRCDRIVDCLGGEDEVGCIYNFVPDVGAAKSNTTTVSDYYPESEATTAQPRDTLLGNIQIELPQNATTDADSTTTKSELYTTEATSSAEVSSTTTWTTLAEIQVTSASTMILSSIAMPKTTAELSNVTVAGTTAPLDEESGTTPQIAADATTAVDQETTATESATSTATASVSFGEFNSDADPAAAPKEHIFVHKRENATEVGVKPQISQKFICRTIPQIIEQSNRCDRFSDCEDGTDEDGCSCRDYLKGSLSILVCDGKTDCDDLSDEEDCGDCKSDEYLCPLSRTCIPLQKRCDNVVDCKFKEDEKDCFALTNGKHIVLDENRQPTFSSMGIFSRNTHGVWRVVCTHETSFHSDSAKAAGDVCSMLGFKGFKFFNATEIPAYSPIVPIVPEIGKKPRLRSQLSSGLQDNLHFASAENIVPLMPAAKMRTESIEPVTDKCTGIYLECDARSNQTLPLKTISAGQVVKSHASAAQTMTPMLKTHDKPNVFVSPELPALMVKKKEEIFDKLHSVIDSTRNASVMVNNRLHEAMEELHWPWLVDIYANGKLWCLGALVDKHWVMVHETCYFGVRLNTDYMIALVGGGKSKDNPHQSPSEQIRRVDCFHVVANSDIMLYHLDQPVHFTHHVLPTFLPSPAEYNASAKHECIAVLHDNQFGRTKAVPIEEHKDDRLCRNSAVTCYRLMAQQPSKALLQQAEVSAEDMATISGEVELKLEANHTESHILSQFTACTQFGLRNATGAVDPIDQGILVCRNIDSGWYPSALFAYNNTDCSSFKDSFGIRTLEKVYKIVQDTIDQATCPQTYEPPDCTTFRCPLGKCLPEERICDGQADCHDASDEDADMCMRVKTTCKASEMQCRTSRKCIPKTKFCDHVPDCDDWTDEPTICSCFTYLQATDPSKICDGIRNCWDKSDESTVLCNCTANYFQCGTIGAECVPRDFVCDKEPDCPNGEDERYCYGLEQPMVHAHAMGMPDLSRPPKYGQVIEQSYGVWHTKCFPRNSPPDVNEVRQICKKLGYNPYRQPSYRLIDDTFDEVIATNETPDMNGRSFGDAPIANKYRKATKTMVMSKFSPLQLNDQLTLFLKPSRPIAELVRWNATDSSRCLRLEIRCA